MNTHQITIAGETFSIKSDASAEHVQNLAKEIQRRFDAINNRKGPRASQELRAMAMVAMVLLDELHELTEKQDKTVKSAVSFAKSISSQIDDLLLRGMKENS
jgi:cell division protein ZapA (FtsZ GTPase activity inhibitor)